MLGERANGGVMRFHADGVEHRIGATPAGHLAQLIADVVREIHGFHSVPFCHAAAVRNRFYGNDPLAEVAADSAGELPHRTEAEDCQRAALGDIGVGHPLPGSGQDIGEVEIAFIR